jgi:hypothetical protein
LSLLLSDGNMAWMSQPAENLRALVETVLKPWCRAYALSVLGDRPADLTYELLCALVFYAELGYWPRFRSPRSFSEKVWHRGLYDRDPCWTLLTDKLRARDYVQSLVGSDYLIPLLWSGREPSQIPFETLPSRFVLKANHGSNYNILVPDKQRLDRAAAIDQLSYWLTMNYCESQVAGMEWGYKHVVPRVMVEAFIGERDCGATDYKLYCFSGRTEFIQIDTDRGRDDHRRSFFDREMTFLPMRIDKPYHEELPPVPPMLAEMIRVADVLSGDFPHIRVDFFTSGDRFYFCELTPYTGGGVTPLTPTRYDFIFGEKWELRGHRCLDVAAHAHD